MPQREHMVRARRVAAIGMAVSGALALMKIIVGYRAGSAAVMADGFESAADVFASGLVLVGMIVAARPPDENHPYGHGRAETLSGLLIGFFLFAAGVLIAWHGITGASDATLPAAYAIWPLLISIAAKSGLAIAKYASGRRIRSSSLLADAANDSIDVLSGLVALVAVSLTLVNPVRFVRADHYGAFCVGLIVMFVAGRVVHEASSHLMDTMPEDDLMRSVRLVALGVPDVKGVEKCFARKTGLQYHVDLHLEVDPDITVKTSHEIARRVRDRIREQLDWVADVLVHVEPASGGSRGSR
jgi:cation diffusion facilitator family transporter